MCSQPGRRRVMRGNAAVMQEAALRRREPLVSINVQLRCAVEMGGVTKPLEIDDLPSIATRDELPDVTRRIVDAWASVANQTKLPWA